MKKFTCLLLLFIILTQTVFISKAEATDDVKTYQISTESILQDYFAESVLIGDSVALGYSKYARTNKDSVVANMTFLTEGGFGAANALKPLDKGLNPIYQGQRQYIWDSIAKTGAKRVFISYGINDLNPLNKRIITQYTEVINRITETSPDISINIVSITPVLSGAECGRINNDFIDEVNTQLHEIADEKGWGFIDIASKLKDENGNLSPSYCSDGFIHLNKTTYSAIWDPMFKQFAEEQLAEMGYVIISEMLDVIITTSPCELYSQPDEKSEILFTIPAETEVVAKGLTTNGMYLLDLGDGNDYFIKAQNAMIK